MLRPKSFVVGGGGGYFLMLYKASEVHVLYMRV